MTGLKKAQIRLQESEPEARQQTEESPYRSAIPWGKVALFAVAAVGIGYGGYKVLRKLVA